jgi:hypothetical protein
VAPLTLRRAAVRQRPRRLAAVHSSPPPPLAFLPLGLIMSFASSLQCKAAQA